MPFSGTSFFTSARAFHDLGAFVFSKHAFHTEEHLPFGRIFAGRINEVQFYLMGIEFFGEQHKVGKIAR